MVKRAAGAAALGLRAMAAKDWKVHKNVIEINWYFQQTIATGIQVYNSSDQFQINWNNHLSEMW